MAFRRPLIRATVLAIAFDVLLAPAAGIAQAPAPVSRSAVPGGAGAVDVRDFGAKGDGVTDDAAAIARAVAALPSRGGVLSFPCGTYATRSASALVTITDKSGVTIQGMGAPCTVLQQAGPGNGIELIGNVDITNVVVRDLSLLGGDQAGKGIDTLNMKDGVIERVVIWGFLNHAIDLRGAGNLHNVVRQTRITAGSRALPTGRALNVRAGNNNLSEFNYYNIGGPGRYDTAIDARGSSPLMSIGDIFDGTTYAIQSNGPLVVLMPYFDFHNVKYGVYPQANNSTVVIGERGGRMDQIIHNPGHAVSDKYLTVIGSNDATGGLVAGAVLGTVATPQRLSANVNDYAPPGSRHALVWRLSGAAPQTITGIAEGVDGKMLTVSNVGRVPLTLANQNAGSTDAHRIITGSGGDLAIAPDGAATLYYDGASARWRVIAVR